MLSSESVKSVHLTAHLSEPIAGKWRSKAWYAHQLTAEAAELWLPGK